MKRELKGELREQERIYFHASHTIPMKRELKVVDGRGLDGEREASHTIPMKRELKGHEGSPGRRGTCRLHTPSR